MNFMSILALVLQAMTTRNAAFAVTVGAKHFSVTITENSVPGNSGNFMAILQIVFQVLSGIPGTFTIGVFTVNVAPLGASPAAPASVPSASGIPASVPPQGAR